PSDHNKERGDLQLLQKIFGRQKAARVERTQKQHHDHASEGDRDRRIDPPLDRVRKPPLRIRAHGKSSSRLRTWNTLAEPTQTAARSTRPWKSGCQSGSRLNTNRRSPIVRNFSAPNIAPIALPEPPNNDTPPSTTAASENSV